MKKMIMQFLPAIVFAGVAALAIIQNRDYVEAGIWGLFALAVVLPSLPGNGSAKRTLKTISIILMIAGIILLILRVLNILPVPVRPLSQI